MYRHCLFCSKHLGDNEVIEAFPVGKRLAFDGERGRLWVVCHRCERWNLTPLAERWEAVEECERLFRELKMRVSTENIGLAKHGSGLQLVRIGEPQRPEFAAWRYGDQFGRRRRRQIVYSAAGAAALGGMIAGGAIAGIAVGGLIYVPQVLMHLFTVSAATRTVIRIESSSGRLHNFRGRDLKHIQLATSTANGLEILAKPWNVRPFKLTGSAARTAAARIMPLINPEGASTARVQNAVQHIAEAGHPEDFIVKAVQANPPKELNYATTQRLKMEGGGLTTLAGLPHPTRLALEMALHEEQERRALHGELKMLELAWQQAEEIAAIEDDLLLPEGTEQRLDEMREE